MCIPLTPPNANNDCSQSWVLFIIARDWPSRVAPPNVDRSCLLLVPVTVRGACRLG